jgi:hypothetical protein
MRSGQDIARDHWEPTIDLERRVVEVRVLYDRDSLAGRLVAAQKNARIDAEGIRDLTSDAERDVTRSALDTGQVRPINARSTREVFLRLAAPNPQFTEASAKPTRQIL